MRFKLKLILGLPKSLYFNLYHFPLKVALKFPVLVAPDVKLIGMGKRGSVSIVPGKKIFIGFESSFLLGGRTVWDISNDGKVCFCGTASIGRGCKIIVKGKLEFGDGFWCNADCIINVGKNIKFGKDCHIGWNVMILDGDGHAVNDKSIRYDDIEIGNHVLIAHGVSVLKGSLIPDGCVVAAKGLVSKKISRLNSLIGGFNKILREDITWVE